MSDISYLTIDKLANDIVSNYHNKILLVYANNGIGKTRTSYALRRKFDNNEVLCFSAFFEEYFIWKYDESNDDYYIEINDYDSVIYDAIINNGLDSEINKNFIYFINKKININFEIYNLKITKITFSLTTGDDAQINNIKISKGEETLFIWSIFYSIVNQRLSDIADGVEDDLKYIIIDDPVTSLVEENIVSIAVQIKKDIKTKIGKIHELGLEMGMFISTHNKIFWNLLFNEFRINNKSCKKLVIEDGKYMLKEQNDSPFGYHINLKEKIINNIKNNTITKEDFHNFRVILEKISNFYGYSKWDYFLNKSLSRKSEIIRLIDYYSHDNNDELEDKIMDLEYQKLFANYFEQFLEDYKWEEHND